MAKKWKDDEIEKYIQSKQVTQENYVAPTVKVGTIDTSSSNKKKYTTKKLYDTPIGPNKNDARTIKTPSTLEDFRTIKNEKEKALNTKQKEYEKSLSKTLDRSGTDFKVEFKNKQGQQLKYQNKEKDKEEQVVKPKINLSIPEANKQVQKQVDERNAAYNDYKIAKAQYDEAKVNSEKTTLADKTIMTPVRAIADLGSVFTDAGEDSYIKDKKGNKTFLPNYNELKQQKVRQDTKSLVGGIAQDAVYNGTKILGASALDGLTGGVGGKALYWTDMSADNYKNVVNQGYDKKQAIANTLISTGSEYVTEKLLGGVASKVVGKSSPAQNILSDTINKVLKKPVISNIIGSMGSEGLEEFTQEFIGAINNKLTLNKDANLFDVFKDALYSAAVGMASASMTTGASNVEGKITQQNINELNNTIKQLETERANITNENTKNKINETINTAQEYINKPFTTNPVETFNNVNNNLAEIEQQKRNDVQGLQLPNEVISNKNNISQVNDNVNNQVIHNNVINDYNNQIKQEVENNDIANSSEALNLGKNIENSQNKLYNDFRGEENEKVRDDSGTNRRGDLSFQSDNKREMGETIPQRRYTKEEYTEFERTVNKNRTKQPTKEQLDIRENIKNSTGKNVVFFDGDNTYLGGSSSNDKNTIYVSSNKSSKEQHFIANHEVLESEILHNNKFKSEYADNAINEILDDPNFEMAKKIFKGDDKKLDNVSDRLIAKDILCNAYAELKTGHKTAYDLPLSEQTMELINYTLERADETLKNNITKSKVNNSKNNILYENKSDNDVLKINDDGTSEMLSDKPKILDKVPDKKKKTSLREEWQWAKRKFVDKGETIYRISKQTKNNTLYHKYDRMGTSIGEAQNQIGEAQSNLLGKKYTNFTDNKGNNTSMSVDDIWKDANNSGISDKVLNEYLVNYLNLDRLNQGKEQFGNLTAYESQDTINKLEKEHPEIKRVANNIWQYNKNQLQKLVDAGLVSKESQKYYNENTPHYVRIQRSVNKSSNPIFDDHGHLKVNNGIQTVKGGISDIMPLKETMAQQTVDTTSAIRRNLFGQELLKTLGNGQESDLIAIDNDLNINPDILSDDGKGNYTFTIYKDGKAVTIPIDKGVYEAVKPNEHYEWENKLPARVARSASSVQRALLTDKNPLFMATNFFKDFGDAPLNSKYSTPKFVAHYGEAIADAFAIGKQKGKYSRLYEALGGNQNSYFNQGEFTKKGKIGKAVDFAMTPIEVGNEYIERLPRLAEFITTIKENGYEVNNEGDLVARKGKNPSKSVDTVLNEAMYNAAEITTNFKRGGSYTKAANRNGFTFLNASVQGFDKQIRNFTEIGSPKQAVKLMSKALILGIGAGLLNNGMYSDDDDYKDLPDYVKDNYYLFKGKDGKWVRIPKGRAISIIQSAARRTKNLTKGDKDAFKGFGELIGNQIAPNNPFENNIVSPFVSIKNNKSWSGNKIVSDAISNESHPEEEYDAKTDEFSKWLGKQLHKSPKKINYLIDQYTGVIGDLVLPALSKYAENEKNDALSRIVTNPVQDKFTTDTVLNNKNYSVFQDTFEKAKNDKNWSKGTDNDKVKYSYLNSKNLEISDYYKQMREIQESNKSDKQKFKEAKEIQNKINKTAKDAVEKSKTIKGNKDYKEIDGNYYYKYYNKDGTYSWRKDSSDSIPNERYYLAEYYQEKVAARKKRAKEGK